MPQMRVEVDREDDGRWLAEVPELPGVIAYGGTREEAIARTQALALPALADRLEHGGGMSLRRRIYQVATAGSTSL